MQTGVQGSAEFFQKVRAQVGDEVFLDGRRLVACAEDLIPGRNDRAEIEKIKIAYGTAEGEITAMVRLLIGGRGDLKKSVKTALGALSAAPMSEDDAIELIDGILCAFGSRLTVKNTLSSRSSSSKKGLVTFAAVAALALAAVVVFVMEPRTGEKDEADAVSSSEEEIETAEGQTQPSADSESANAGLDEAETYVQEQATGPVMPKTEPEIVLDQVDSVVYADNVTDLAQYAVYEAQGKGFTFGYPKALYDEVHLESGMFDSSYIFTGDDGSYLKYYCYTMTSKKSVSEWRELLTASLTEGMSEVQVLAFSDGDNEGHFYLTAKEGDLDVVVVGTIYSSLADCMILKYPTPQDEEDRLCKAYYTECLYCLAEFSDSQAQGHSLRTFDEFISAQ